MIGEEININWTIDTAKIRVVTAENSNCNNMDNFFFNSNLTIQNLFKQKF